MAADPASAVSSKTVVDALVACIEIERKVFGWLVRDDPGTRTRIPQVREWAQCLSPLHAKIIAAICANLDRGLEASPSSIAIALADDPELAAAGGREYLLQWSLAAPAIVSETRGATQIDLAIATHRNITARLALARDARDVATRLESGDPEAFEHLAELGRSATQEDVASSIVAKPFEWRDPSSIPTRRWLYGRHAIRGFISATIAPGGIGKTALLIAEALALVSNRNIFNDGPIERAPVWYLGLEDSADEYERRVAAAALLHKISPSTFAGGLFLNSGRAGEFLIASASRDGLQIHQPIVSAIIENIRRHNIGLLIVDPAVASHAVPESDNTLQAAIMRKWACIADETNAGVELVHHIRKSGGSGGDGNADDARGASAFVNAARSVRQLIPMTAEEAARGGVHDRRRFFRVMSAKANLAPYSEGGAWRELVSITLRNGGGGPDDLVGAVAPWQMPDATSIASPADVEAIRKRLADGTGRADPQAKAWAGNAIADVLGLDTNDKGVKDSIRRAIQSWLLDGTLRTIEANDEKRRPREFIVPGDRS